MRIVTERLVLREFRESDRDDYIRLRDNEDFLRFYDEEERSHAFTGRLLKSFINGAREEPRRVFQLAVTMDGKLIGTCGIRQDRGKPSIGWFGVEIKSSHWRNGYATEAGKAMLEFALTRAGVKSVYAETTPENLRSRNMLGKLGMLPLKSIIEDRTIIYRLPVKDWQAVKPY